jgi:hypothetical protein
MGGRLKVWRGVSSDGSSLIETALVMPILIGMLCFAVDIGYLFIVAANLVSSCRNAVLYSGQGFVSPAQQRLPSAGAAGSLVDTDGVAGLVGGDLSGLSDMSTRTSVEVCSKKNGVSRTANGYITNCSTYPSGTLNFTVDQDPESNNGLLTQRVDVIYTVSLPIPFDFFSFTMPPLTLHWKAEMRVID